MMGFISGTVIAAILLFQPILTNATDDEKSNEFPYQVYLKDKSGFECGGVILSPWFVVTAAQCVFIYSRDSEILTSSSKKEAKLPKISDLQIVAGVHDRTKSKYYSWDWDVMNRLQERTAYKIYIHKDFDLLKSENNIAIVALRTPFDFDEHVDKIQLFPNDMEMNLTELGTSTGWGKSEFLSSPTSDLLQSSEIRILSKPEAIENCSTADSTFQYEMNICGVATKDGEECRGDTGGPLVCPLEGQNEKFLCGILSNGPPCCYFDTCSQQKSQSIFSFFSSSLNLKFGSYVNVTYHADWIRKTIEDHKLQGKCNRDHFYCQEDNICIPREQLCDSKEQCSRGSDEKTCININSNPVISKLLRSAVNWFMADYKPSDPESYFQCDNGLKISVNRTCSGDDFCMDGSADNKCDFGGKDRTCENDQWACISNGRCIEKGWKCDEIIDCEDSSDEDSDCNNNISGGIDNSTDSFNLDDARSLLDHN